MLNADNTVVDAADIKESPVPLAPELDSAALVGWSVAQSALHFDGYATTVYARTRDDAVTDVQAVLAATANP